MPKKPVVAISSCLVGQRVRYDGNDKLQDWIDELNNDLSLVPVCPEFELGMGVPREKIQLEWSEDGVQLFGIDSRKNWTSLMTKYAEERCEALDNMDLCGFILKSRSPSCGIANVHVQNCEEPRTASGRFAKTVLSKWPELPVVDETMLNLNHLRQEFVAKVCSYQQAYRS
tara:strand:+ start:71 stop:583 length:513 start_codon:yes stop_codon:yes gene_type:complete